MTLRWPHPIWWEIIAASARRIRMYRMGLLLSLIGMLLQLFLLKTVWEAVYGDRQSLNGIEQQQLLVYLTVTGLQRFLMPDAIAWEIDERVSTGKVAGDLVRPFGFIRQMMAQQLGNTLGNATWFVIAVPFALVIGSLRMPGIGMLAVYLASLVLAYAINLLIWTMAGLASFWLLNASGLRATFGMMMGLLSGSVVPLWFMPDWMETIVRLLPFQAAYFLPGSIFAGQVDGGEVAPSLIVQCIWIVILGVVVNVAWKRATTRLVIQGG